MWWRVARRGPAAPGPVSCRRPPPPRRVRRRGGGDERRAGPATRGPRRAPSPRGDTRGSRDARGTPQRERGKWGGLGGGEDPAPAPQLLPDSLTSGRRKQLGGLFLWSGVGFILLRCARHQHSPRTESSNQLLEKYNLSSPRGSTDGTYCASTNTLNPQRPNHPASGHPRAVPARRRAELPKKVPCPSPAGCWLG